MPVRPRSGPPDRRSTAVLLVGLLALVSLLPAVAPHGGAHHLDEHTGGGHEHHAWSPGHAPHDAARIEATDGRHDDHCTVCTLRPVRTADASAEPTSTPAPPSAPAPTPAAERPRNPVRLLGLQPRAPPRI